MAACRTFRRMDQPLSHGIDAPPVSPHPLQEARDGRWTIDLEQMVEIADVNPELESARRDDDAVLTLPERPLRVAPVGRPQGSMRERCGIMTVAGRSPIDLARTPLICCGSAERACHGQTIGSSTLAFAAGGKYSET